MPVAGPSNDTPASADPECDAAVVRRVRSGDVDAFGVLVARYQPRCARFALRMLTDSEDAADAVQLAFVRAYEALHRYNEDARFVGWLFAILTNECRAIAARHRRRAKYMVVDDAAVQQAIAPEPDGVDDRSERLSRAVSRLEPLLREAFVLRHIEGLSYVEMVESTGAGTSALKMRVKRACDALRTMLEER